ncbi:YrhA family protein [Lactovum odontotermitis]
MTWKESLVELNKDNEQYGESANLPANNIDEVVAFAANKFHLCIPKEFTEFWKVQNGLEYDGNVFYQADIELFDDIDPLDMDTNNAIIASNIIWHENADFADYTFLGDGNIDWCVYDRRDKKYKILDKPSGEIIETFDTFDEFFSTYLERLVEQM